MQRGWRGVFDPDQLLLNAGNRSWKKVSDLVARWGSWSDFFSNRFCEEPSEEVHGHFRIELLFVVCSVRYVSLNAQSFCKMRHLRAFLEVVHRFSAHIFCDIFASMGSIFYCWQTLQRYWSILVPLVPAYRARTGWQYSSRFDRGVRAWNEPIFMVADRSFASHL